MKSVALNPKHLRFINFEAILMCTGEISIKQFFIPNLKFFKTTINLIIMGLLLKIFQNLSYIFPEKYMVYPLLQVIFPRFFFREDFIT